MIQSTWIGKSGQSCVDSDCSKKPPGIVREAPELVRLVFGAAFSASLWAALIEIVRLAVY